MHPTVRSSPSVYLQTVQEILQSMQAHSRLRWLLGSPVHAEILIWLFLHPERAYPVGDLAWLFRVSSRRTWRDFEHLLASGLVTGTGRGDQLVVRANNGTPLARPLADLIAMTYGPLAVLGELLAGTAGVAGAYLYGSWAARYLGEPGLVPHDVDLLVIGAATQDDLKDVVRAAQHRLSRRIDIKQVAPEEWWRWYDSLFLRTVIEGPLVEIDLTVERMRALASAQRAELVR